MTRTVHVTHWKKIENVPKKEICDFERGASEIFLTKKKEIFERKRFLFGGERCATLKRNKDHFTTKICGNFFF